MKGLQKQRQVEYRAKRKLRNMTLPEPLPQTKELLEQLEAPAPRRGNAQAKPNPYHRDKLQYRTQQNAAKAERTKRKLREKEGKRREKERKEMKKALMATHKNGQPKLESRMKVILEQLQRKSGQ